MATKKRGLGKGLDALIGGNFSKDEPVQSTGDSLKKLGVDQLQRGQYQPRTVMDKDALQELADSIKAQGLVQPIIVRPLKEKDKYEIIAGERRWRASQMAGLHEVPVVIKDIPDQAAMAMALIENIQREDLNPIEEAMAFSRLRLEFDMTHNDIAEAVGRSRSSVTNLLRLLELQTEVREWLEQGQLEMGHARALLALERELQLDAARQIIAKGLTVRSAEALIRNLQSGQKPKTEAKSPVRDPNILNLEKSLSEKLATRVEIKHGNKGAGMLSFHYHNLDELDGLLKRIK